MSSKGPPPPEPLPPLPTNPPAPSEADSPPPSTPPPPPIAALFLVVFDHRKGYVLQWEQKTDPSLDLEGVVEYKCLPSGLHNVEEDLVYFVLGNGESESYVGISAYVNQPNDASARHARMLAVGCLVSIGRSGGGRMGKSWLHAEGLKRLAEEQIKDLKDTKGLEEYWQENRGSESIGSMKPHESTDSLGKVGNGHADGYHSQRHMSASSISVPGEGPTMAPHHPATVLMNMLSTFGPLIFPLYRAALLRKRILLVTEAPVEIACDLVYNCSVISSLSWQATQYIGDTSSRRTITPLFSVGIQDIDSLSKLRNGWIACTTDEVLATKPELFDLAVYMPGRDAKQARKKVWPKLVPSGADPKIRYSKVGTRASQRDAIRYGGLVEGLKHVPSSQVAPGRTDNIKDAAAVDQEDWRSTYSSRAQSLHEHREIVEPASWSRVAYTSLLWWASAGDTRDGLTGEDEDQIEQDAALLDVDEDDESRTKEVVMVSYFRNMTNAIFHAVHQVLRQELEEEEAVEDEDDDGADEHDGSSDEVQDRRSSHNPADQPHESHEQHAIEHHIHTSIDESNLQLPLLQKQTHQPEPQEDDDVHFSSEDMSAMGLDVWSSSDRQFVEELVSTWWNRRAVVRGGRVECCGVRIL